MYGSIGLFDMFSENGIKLPEGIKQKKKKKREKGKI